MAKAERVRREKVWAACYTGEWEEWQRVQPLLNVVIDFFDPRPFDFDDFMKEVGRRRSAAHVVARVDESMPYQPGNLAWVVEAPEPPGRPT